MTPRRLLAAADTMVGAATRADIAAAGLASLVVSDLARSAWQSRSADEVRTRLHHGGAAAIGPHLRRLASALRDHATACRTEAARLAAIEAAAQADTTRTSVTSAPSQPRPSAPAPAGAT